MSEKSSCNPVPLPGDEFPEGASVLDDPSRRTLLKLMGASLGLAGLTACSRPVENILPAAKGVEDQIPGNPLFYATAMSLGGVATGLLVEAHDGRPTKIEGNPDHLFSRGAASAFHQASILGLYDPDRSREVMHDGQPSTWDEFAGFAKDHFSAAASERLRFLSQTVNSPSLEAVRAHALSRFPQAKWIEYEPISEDQVFAGSELAFGRVLRPIYHFDQADVILSLDADFLALDSPAVAYTKEFSARRRVAARKDSMNRLYAVESQFSVTGAMADHRLRLRAGEIAEFAADLARELSLLPAGLNILNNDPRRKWLAALARDLKKSAGRSLVLAGPRQPAAVHAAEHWINHALGNSGKTVTYVETARRPQLPALEELASDISAGRVETLVILGGNPAYDAPADLEFSRAIQKAPTTIHLGAERNETGVLAKWHLPEAHYLESWGDARAVDGTASIQQPLIQPLYGGQHRGGDPRAHLRLQGPAGLRHRSQLLAGPVARRAGREDLAQVPARRRCPWHGFLEGAAGARREAYCGGACRAVFRCRDSKSTSIPAPAPGTAGLPTTAGSKKRPTR